MTRFGVVATLPQYHVWKKMTSGAPWQSIVAMMILCEGGLGPGDHMPAVPQQCNSESLGVHPEL